MGRKSFSVDLVNEFVMDNFRPYAWANLWEETEPDELGVFSFLMVVSPQFEDSYKTSSSNSMVILNPEFYGCDVINIPMVRDGSWIWYKRERTKNHISQLKGEYRDYLATACMGALNFMEINRTRLIQSKRDVFGTLHSGNLNQVDHETKWGKLLAYERGEPRENWSFIPLEEQDV